MLCLDLVNMMVMVVMTVLPACVVFPATGTRLQEDCNVPFFAGNLSMARASASSGVAGQPLHVQLTSNSTFSTRQCASNGVMQMNSSTVDVASLAGNSTGWQVSLVQPDNSTVELHLMADCAVASDVLYKWNMILPGSYFTKVSWFYRRSHVIQQRMYCVLLKKVLVACACSKCSCAYLQRGIAEANIKCCLCVSAVQHCRNECPAVALLMPNTSMCSCMRADISFL
jgi:hypothetical protein